MTLKGDEKFGQKLNRSFQISPKQIGNFFFPAGEKGQNFNFHWFVLSKRQIAWTKKFHRSLILWHWRAMKSLGKSWTVVSKSAPQKLVNFFPAGDKGRIFKFYWFVLSKRQISWTKNFSSSLILWHWRAMKSLRKDWTVVSNTAKKKKKKKKKGKIFLQQEGRVEFSNFIGLFCLKGKLLEQKTFKRISFYDTEGIWNVWPKTELWFLNQTPENKPSHLLDTNSPIFWENDLETTSFCPHFSWPFSVKKWSILVQAIYFSTKQTNKIWKLDPSRQRNAENVETF